MSELTIFSNAYGQNLLRLVSRGNATIAELMRLKDYIPPAYRYFVFLTQFSNINTNV